MEHIIERRDYPIDWLPLLLQHNFNYTDHVKTWFMRNPDAEDFSGYPCLVAIFRCKPKPVSPTEVFHWSEEQIISRLKIAYPCKYKDMLNYIDINYLRGIDDSNRLNWAINLIKTKDGKGYNETVPPTEVFGENKTLPS